MPEPAALTGHDVTTATAAMRREQDARDVLSGHLEPQLLTLFPLAPPEFLKSNGHFSNELARGAGEIMDAVSAASINWTGPTDDLGVEKLFTKELVRLLAGDALVTAKIALFPRINDEGELEVEALTGYLHAHLSPTNALKVAAVLQVLSVSTDAGLRYEVRRYSPGMLEVFPLVEKWEDFEKTTPKQYPQLHAKGRLPLAFMITRRDAHRMPYGLIGECLSAFRRYAKTAINRNAVQEIAGWPERVVRSTDLLNLALNQRPGEPMQPALVALKRVGPRELKLIGTEDSYEVQDGVDPKPHMEAEETDKQALLDLLRSPDLSGGNATGVALAERQTKSRALITDLCDAIAATVTDACDLAARLPGTNIPEGIEASLTPQWATDQAARVEQVRGLSTALPMSVILQELQTAGWESITDEMLDYYRKQEAWAGGTQPAQPVPQPATPPMVTEEA